MTAIGKLRCDAFKMGIITRAQIILFMHARISGQLASDGDQINAIHWTRRDTKLTTGTQVGKNRMHVLACANNRINRACRNTLSTADTVVLADDGTNFMRALR